MATYYARNVTGNWSSATSWDSASSGGAGPAGPPVAGDTAIFDSGFTGTITVSSICNCATVTAQSGATGTLVFGSGQLLTIDGGNVTFVSGFNLSGTGTLRFNSNSTLTMGGLTFPGSITNIGTSTITLGGDLAITGTLFFNGQTTIAGAYNVSCANFAVNGSGPHTLRAGQTLTVTTSITMEAGPSTGSTGFGSITLKSSSASSPTYIAYTGANASTIKVAGVVFTDIDFSTYSTPVTNLDNWHGGTLTRTSGIYNVTSASLPAITDVKSGVEYGGVDDATANKLTGTYSAAGGSSPRFGDMTGGLR